jgi:MFS family permease
LDRDPESSAALLRHPPFAFLWSCRVLTNVGSQMLAVAVGWQLYALTGSALDLGLVGLAEFAPMIALTLIVGQVADRYDRRLIATTCQIVKAAATAALALGSLGSWQSKASILAIVALIRAARAFENP